MRKVLVVIVAVLAISGCASLKFFGHINTSKLYVGMPRAEIAEAGGHPVKINRTTGPNGVREQWVFETLFGSYVFVYVDNDKVVTWQE